MYGCLIERCVDYNSLIDVFDLKNRCIWLKYDLTVDKVCFMMFLGICRFLTFEITEGENAI